MFISNEVYYICTLSYRLYTEVDGTHYYLGNENQTAKQIQRYNNMDDGEHNALNTETDIPVIQGLYPESRSAVQQNVVYLIRKTMQHRIRRPGPIRTAQCGYLAFLSVVF